VHATCIRGACKQGGGKQILCLCGVTGVTITMASGVIIGELIQITGGRTFKAQNKVFWEREEVREGNEKNEEAAVMNRTGDRTWVGWFHDRERERVGRGRVTLYGNCFLTLVRVREWKKSQLSALNEGEFVTVNVNCTVFLVPRFVCVWTFRAVLNGFGGTRLAVLSGFLYVVTCS
jgi:hypothetical protein